jgi:hypothetical protein
VDVICSLQIDWISSRYSNKLDVIHNLKTRSQYLNWVTLALTIDITIEAISYAKRFHWILSEFTILMKRD